MSPSSVASTTSAHFNQTTRRHIPEDSNLCGRSPLRELQISLFWRNFPLYAVPTVRLPPHLKHGNCRYEQEELEGLNLPYFLFFMQILTDQKFKLFFFLMANSSVILFVFKILISTFTDSLQLRFLDFGSANTLKTKLTCIIFKCPVRTAQ
jgi:hypothetical protein